MDQPANARKASRFEWLSRTSESQLFSSEQCMASGLFTSESVSMGHPDKVADQISDGVLDALLSQDPLSRVACETLCTTDLVVLAGEVTTRAEIDHAKLVRQIVADIG